MAIRWKLYTGGGTIDSIEPILARHGIERATMIPVHGLWKGKLEYGTLVEIISFDANFVLPSRLIAELKQELKQDCILLTIEELFAAATL